MNSGAKYREAIPALPDVPTKAPKTPGRDTNPTISVSKIDTLTVGGEELRMQRIALVPMAPFFWGRT
jgi:hypothetical protein